MSEDWIRVYGQRNQVEMSNRLLKDHSTENLGDPKARTWRGYAYNYLVAMLATGATNIRRIMVGITKINTLDENGKPKQRVRKHRDSNGYRLTRDASPQVNDAEEQVLPPDPHRE